MGEAAIGDYLGLSKWRAGEMDWQVNLGGGVFGRFDLAAKTNDMQSSDFFVSLPLDARRGAWSGRFAIYHTSSHLGDDYIARTGQTTEKRAWDNLRWLVSRDFGSALRLYAGYTYSFRSLPGKIGRSAMGGGFEWFSSRRLGPWQPYWANDFQSWERVGWNPAFNSQAGLKVTGRAGSGRGLCFFVEFGAGAMPQGQFFRQRETRWVFGAKFNLI
jgi:hypothetical protein